MQVPSNPKSASSGINHSLQWLFKFCSRYSVSVFATQSLYLPRGWGLLGFWRRYHIFQLLWQQQWERLVPQSELRCGGWERDGGVLQWHRGWGCSRAGRGAWIRGGCRGAGGAGSWGISWDKRSCRDGTSEPGAVKRSLTGYRNFPPALGALACQNECLRLDLEQRNHTDVVFINN